MYDGWLIGFKAMNENDQNLLVLPIMGYGKYIEGFKMFTCPESKQSSNNTIFEGLM